MIGQGCLGFYPILSNFQTNLNGTLWWWNIGKMTSSDTQPKLNQEWIITDQWWTVSGIRESCHLQTWKTVEEWSKRSCINKLKRFSSINTRTWSVLHHSLCWSLWEDWHENTDLWCATSRGGKYCWSYLNNFQWNIFQILTKDSVTVFVNAIMYYKVRCPTSAVANVDDYR